MNYFLNLVNGQASINSFRKPECEVTDVNDIIQCFEQEKEENLVADLTGWIKEEGGDLENDNLERVIEGVFGLDLSEYPELRDIQREANE